MIANAFERIITQYQKKFAALRAELNFLRSAAPKLNFPIPNICSSLEFLTFALYSFLIILLESEASNTNF